MSKKKRIKKINKEFYKDGIPPIAYTTPKLTKTLFIEGRRNEVDNDNFLGFALHYTGTWEVQWLDKNSGAFMGQIVSSDSVPNLIKLYGV